MMQTGKAMGPRNMRAKVAAVVIRPAALACLPAICLGGYWMAGQAGLIALAIALPLIYLILGGADAQREIHMAERDPRTGLYTHDAFAGFVEKALGQTVEKGLFSAVLMVDVDDHGALISRHGQAAADAVLTRLGERLVSTMRDSDAVVRKGDYRFTACLAPVRHLDLELGIQLAGRIQAAIEEPVSLDGTSVYVTASVGFCLDRRAPSKTGEDWMEAAGMALMEAQSRGPASIRAYSDEMRKRAQTQIELRQELSDALENGQIQPWFQPQISTDTGMLTGFEALARWSHPQRGMISPADFLPEIERSGMLERLADVMMFHAFSALKAWDLAGIDVPQVGVNFAGPELSNPHLVEKIQWELDRFDLTPDRLAVEVLETVVAGAADDMTTRNINGLSKLGCRIDLDDFGTGHASISSIRRFSVSRIKIDRSFVMKSDRDPEQQRMISAILTMAERLNVETLAEGVESVGEHALLAQLGCNHVQGFGIGKPMPFDETIDWIQAHNAKLVDAPKILQKRTK